MNVLIAVPAMDYMPTLTVNSLLALRQCHPSRVSFVIHAQIQDARNMLAYEAIDSGADRVLWIDSDQTFKPDLMERLSADLDEGFDMVTGLYFTRDLNMHPVIWKEVDGKPVRYTDYPKDQLFPICACGFGAVMCTTELLKRAGEKPFSLLPGMSEDISFCARVHGARIACDSRVKVGHIGLVDFGEPMRGR